jgi:hypothetical protein
VKITEKQRAQRRAAGRVRSEKRNIAARRRHVGDAIIAIADRLAAEPHVLIHPRVLPSVVRLRDSLNLLIAGLERSADGSLVKVTS